jgi:hypothetical protein
MDGRLSQDGCNELSLVLRRDRSVASLAIRQIDDAFFDNGRARKGIEQPLRENVGRRCTIGTPDQSKTRSAIQ